MPHKATWIEDIVIGWSSPIVVFIPSVDGVLISNGHFDWSFPIVVCLDL